MEYISHEDFKSLMGKFQKETPKGVLKEAVEEGNAFTAALAKTKKGQKAKVDGHEITDTSSYDDPTVKEGNDEVDQRLEKIADLHKGKKIDFETIEKIADALKAKGHEVNARYVQQFLSQHGVGMNEYGYADQYPGAWPFREEEMEEGLHMPPLQATGPTVDTVEEDMFKLPVRKDTSVLDYDPDASRFEPDYMKTPGEDDDDDEDNFDLDDDDFDISSTDELPKPFRKTVTADKSRYPFLRENSIANPPFGFDVLSPDERKQLEEYITSIKTIKKEITKLAAKAGKKVKEGDLGGNRTGLVMTPSTMSEGHQEIKKIEKKIPEKLYSASVKVIGELKKAGLTDAEIEMFLKHEIEEKAKEAIMAQHD